MAYTRRVEQVEAPIAKEIQRVITADLQTVTFTSKVNLADVTIPVYYSQVFLRIQEKASITDRKSESLVKASSRVGQPGIKASLKPGPTIRSVEGGKVLTSPL